MNSAASADDILLRRAAVRMGWQIALASALVVIVAALATFAIGPLLHDHGGPHSEVGPDHDDDILRTTLLIAGLIGVAVAGLAGFVVARRAVAPIGAALALQRRFVADAGHELRTPLTVLHTRAQLIARRMRPDDPVRPAVDQLLDDSRVLGQIVDELLASAQLTANPQVGEIVDLSELADAVTASMTVLADGNRVRLSRTGAGSGVFVRGSRPALRRAITSLVDNALGHTPPDGHIVVDVTADHQSATVAITDDGEGLRGGDPAVLVERFARGQDAPSEGRRFGLGLSLVREVAIAHGGTFWIAPAASRGTTAVIRVPSHTPNT